VTSAGAGALKEAVAQAEASLGTECRRVYYLSVPPPAALPAVTLHFYLVFPRPKAFFERYRHKSLAVLYGVPLFFLFLLIQGYLRIRWLNNGGADLPEGLEGPSQSLRLLLDEVSDMPLETQGKILRVLVEQRFQRLGGGPKVHVDVRVVSSTSHQLLEALADHLATTVLELDARIDAVTVGIRKLRPPVAQQLSTSGVRITRAR